MNENETIVIAGFGIMGMMEMYYAYLAHLAKCEEAKLKGEPIPKLRIMVFDTYSSPEQASDSQRSTGHWIHPSLTDNEMWGIITELAKAMALKFDTPPGVMVTDRPEVATSPAGKAFFDAVMADLQNFPADVIEQRRKAIIALGQLGMLGWRQLLNNPELAELLKQSKFRPCASTDGTRLELNLGWRIDPLFNMPNEASTEAENIAESLRNSGRRAARVLTPDEVVKIDPSLERFCIDHSTVQSDGSRQWDNATSAIWRPGGSVNTGKFLIDFAKWLETKTNDPDRGLSSQFFYGHKVTKLHFDTRDPQHPRAIGLNYQNTQQARQEEEKTITFPDKETEVVLTPGSNTQTISNLGLVNLPCAKFAGVSLTLEIDCSTFNSEEKLKMINHCMEPRNPGIVLAWHADYDEGKKILRIGVAGTKAFYADVDVKPEDEFVINRSLVQLQMINSFYPECIAHALGLSAPIDSSQLTLAHMDYLKQREIATVKCGSRSVYFDVAPGIGKPCLKTQDGTGPEVENVVVVTGAGSGGISNGPSMPIVGRFFRGKPVPSIVDPGAMNGWRRFFDINRPVPQLPSTEPASAPALVV